MTEEREVFLNTRVETDTEKCPSCGGTMVFDPATQTLRCDHCGNIRDIVKDFAVVEHDIAEGFAQAERVGKDEQVSYKCDNCGAEVVINSDESAKLCPFCGTSHIVRLGSYDGIKPQVVIPFQLTAEAACDCAKKWAKRRIFAPSKFKKNLEAENTRGVYEPCFTFDSATTSYYVGRVGDRHTRTVGVGKNRRTETYVVYRNVSGTFIKNFDDVMVATNSKFDQNSLDALSPFKSEAACVYDRKYISGYACDKYTKELPDSWTAAKKIIDKDLRKSIERSLHCDVVDYLNVSTKHENVTYKYLLLPVYRTSYRYKGKDYGVSINGSTGKASGKTPLSPIRVGIAVVVGLAIAIGLVALIAKYL